MSLAEQTSWMRALDAQLAALDLSRKLMNYQYPDHQKSKQQLSLAWELDHQLLSSSVPYAWADMPIQAVLAASRTIPLDTELNPWNLDTPAVFWHLDTSLPFQTITAEAIGFPHDVARAVGIRALCMGWVKRQLSDEPRFVVSCWIDDILHKHICTPSQVWHWNLGETLEHMLERCRREHDSLYGKGGIWEHTPQVGTDVFIATAESISRFILAGLVWLNQEVVVQVEARAERHRRKEYERKVGKPLNLRVIQLRRAEAHPHEVDPDHEAKKVDWACRWVVDGHWRHQPCGPGKKDRRLRFINPFLKGPEEKELRLKAPRVYEVRR